DGKVKCQRCNLNLTDFKKDGKNDLRYISFGLSKNSNFLKIAIINDGHIDQNSIDTENLKATIVSQLTDQSSRHLTKNEIIRQKNRPILKIVASSPPKGLLKDETVVKLETSGNSLSLLGGGEARKVVLRPTFSTISHNLRRISQIGIKRDLHKRKEELHLAKDDSLVLKGMEFVISEVEPREGGFLSRRTQISIESTVPDLEKAHLLPFEETLPEDQRSASGQFIGEEFIITNYLRRHFLHRRRLLRENEFVTIEGAVFMVVAAEPAQGVVTCETKFFAEGNFLSFFEQNFLFEFWLNFDKKD
ncbi:hypothetical protein MHBO_002800, partial [Bonamia ostreae]